MDDALFDYYEDGEEDTNRLADEAEERQQEIEAITPNLYEYFVTHLPDRIEDYESEEDQLFPDAKYVMDATFQPIWTPTGTYNEKKQYFSG